MSFGFWLYGFSSRLGQGHGLLYKLACFLVIRGWVCYERGHRGFEAKSGQFGDFQNCYLCYHEYFYRLYVTTTTYKKKITSCERCRQADLLKVNFLRSKNLVEIAMKKKHDKYLKVILSNGANIIKKCRFCKFRVQKLKFCADSRKFLADMHPRVHAFQKLCRQAAGTLQAKRKSNHWCEIQPWQ